MIRRKSSFFINVKCQNSASITAADIEHHARRLMHARYRSSETNRLCESLISVRAISRGQRGRARAHNNRSKPQGRHLSMFNGDQIFATTWLRSSKSHDADKYITVNRSPSQSLLQMKMKIWFEARFIPGSSDKNIHLSTSDHDPIIYIIPI